MLSEQDSVYKINFISLYTQLINVFNQIEEKLNENRFVNVSKRLELHTNDELTCNYNKRLRQKKRIVFRSGAPL